MSLEVLLIPLGIAAVAAIRQARSSDLCEKCKATRITDQKLLEESLLALGATKVQASNGRVTARTVHGPVTFQRIGEIFLGRVDKAPHKTDAMLQDLNAATGTILQYRTVQAVREQAAAMGMTLVEERADDGTVQLVFEQGR